MTLRNPSADKDLLVSRSAAGTAIRDALRRNVGRGKRWSVKELSNASGVPDRAIECAMCEPDDTDWRRLPPEYLLSIAGPLGPEFTSELIATVSQGAYWLPEGDGDAAALNTDCAEFNFEYAKATDPKGPGGTNILPLERRNLVLIAARMTPRARTVSA